MADLRREVVALLRQAGWEFKRPGKGDHEIWWNPKTGNSIVLDHGITSRHTANGILKQAGLPKRF